MGWRLILEEFSPELIYIKGSKNTVIDALSRLDKIDNLNKNSTNSNNNNKHEPTLESLSENFASNIVIYATRCDNFEYIALHWHSTYIYYNVVNIL